MDEQLRFLIDIVDRLEGSNIPYMVTGSIALAVYATPRMTRDLDFVIEVGPAAVDDLVKAFRSDCYVSLEQVRDAVAAPGMFNVIHNEWIIKADFVVRRDEPFRMKEFARRRTFELEGRAVNVVAPEDLILSKLVWARQTPSELQERDVRELLAAVPDLDEEYLMGWAGDLDVAGDLERLRER